MKYLIITILFSSFYLGSNAQSPVTWDFKAKKISPHIYEINLIANLTSSWHIYSQNSPEGGGYPTKIHFTKNPLLILKDNPKEVGNIVNKYEEVFGMNVLFYENTVRFIQIVELKKPVKTSISGEMQFMICNDHECMPPSTVKFSIPLN